MDSEHLPHIELKYAITTIREQGIDVEIHRQIDLLKTASGGSAAIVGQFAPGDATVYDLMMVGPSYRYHIDLLGNLEAHYGAPAVVFTGSMTKTSGGPVYVERTTTLEQFHHMLGRPDVWTTAVYWVATRYFGGFSGEIVGFGDAVDIDLANVIAEAKAEVLRIKP